MDIREGKNQQNSESARSSPEIVVDNQSPISKDNQNVVYERYLSPIENVPTPPESVIAVDREDETYLQPIDELRASKRFLQRSRNGSPEPDYSETYLEPLHGIPVPVSSDSFCLETLLYTDCAPRCMHGSRK